jgi:hypothetical protein
MDIFFNAFLEEYGQPDLRCDAAEETIACFEGILPTKLLEYWRVCGFSRFKAGLLFLTDPSEYSATLDAWISDTALSGSGKYHVIARNGFGDLYVWEEKKGFSHKIKAHRGWIIEQDGSAKLIAAGKSDRAIQGFFSTSSAREKDIDDEDGRPLFDRAVSHLGPLGFDEVFAFEPAICLGGTVFLKNLVKRNIHVHLSLLTQLSTPKVLDDDALRRLAFG